MFAEMRFLGAMTIQWQRFRWDLSAVVHGAHPAEPPFAFRAAAREDRDAAGRVISSGFSTESGWGDISKGCIQQVRKLADDAFEHEEPPCIVVQHGTRIIGVSVLAPEASALNHLITGPCILHEYRSRGLGSLLLYYSLECLKEQGLTVVSGVTRARTVAARFVYPKFGSTSEPCEAGFGPENPARVAA